MFRLFGRNKPYTHKLKVFNDAVVYKYRKQCETCATPSRGLHTNKRIVETTFSLIQVSGETNPRSLTQQ